MPEPEPIRPMPSDFDPQLVDEGDRIVWYGGKQYPNRGFFMPFAGLSAERIEQGLSALRRTVWQAMEVWRIDGMWFGCNAPR